MPKHKVRHGPREYVIDDEAHYEHRVEKRIEWKDDPEDPEIVRRSPYDLHVLEIDVQAILRDNLKPAEIEQCDLHESAWTKFRNGYQEALRKFLGQHGQPLAPCHIAWRGPMHWSCIMRKYGHLAEVQAAFAARDKAKALELVAPARR